MRWLNPLVRAGSSRKAKRYLTQHRRDRRLLLEALEPRHLLTATVDLIDTEITQYETDGYVFWIFGRDDTNGPLTINYQFVSPRTAQAGVDYVDPGTHQVTFPDGQNQVGLYVTLLDDEEYDGDKLIEVELASGSGYTVGTNSISGLNIIYDVATPPATPAPAQELVVCSCSCSCDSSGLQSGANNAAGSLWAGPNFGGLTFNSALLAPQIISVQAGFPEQTYQAQTIHAIPQLEHYDGSSVYYDETQLAADTPYVFTLLAPENTAITATGRYQWAMSLVETYDLGAERIQFLEGYTHIRFNDFPEYGRGWTPKFLDRVVSSTGGISLLMGNGNNFWFEASGGSYLQADGDLSGMTLDYSGGVYTLTDKWGNESDFTGGLLTERRDRFGNATTYSYDQNGVFQSYTDYTGYTLTYTYDGGKLDSIYDSTGMLVTFEFDTAGDLVGYTEADPDGGGPLTAESYDFDYDDTTGWLESIVTPAGETTIVYDDFGRVESLTRPGASTGLVSPYFTFGLIDTSGGLGTVNNPAPLYEAEDAVGIYTDPLENEVRTKTDRFGRETERTDQLSRKTTTTRDADGRPLVVTTPDPDGAGGESAYVTAREYDANGNLELLTHPDSTTEEWEYDLDFNVPVSFTDRLGNVTLYVLDETYGSVLEERRVVGEVDDEINEETDDVVTTYTYTPEPEDPGDPPAGLIAAITDPFGVVTQFAYDEFGNLLTVTYAAGTAVEASVSYAYEEGTNRLLSTTDELGRLTSYTYDAYGRPVATTLPDPDGQGPLSAPVLTNVYDDEGNLWKTIDALNRVTEYLYDARGNQTYVKRPDHDGDSQLTITQHVYSLADQLTSTIDPLGRTTAYAYDDAGQLLTTTLPDPDGQGQLASPVISTTYDALGRVKTTTDALGNVTSNAYSDHGRTVTITLPDPDGAGGQSSPVLVKEYDAAGNLIGETDALSNETTYQYDELGRLVLVTAPDPDGEGGASAPQTAYQYDKRGNLTQIIDPLGNRTVYDYDARGRRIAERHATGALPTIAVINGAPVAGVNEVQLVGFSDMMGLSGGTFTLTFDGQTTGNIAYNASAATVQSALEALSNIAPGDVSVSKTLDTSEDQQWQLTFTGNLAGTNVSQTTVDSTNVWGSGITETETTTAQGSAASEVQVVTLAGATGGTFRLEFGGLATAALDYDATAGEVDAALEALTSIDTVTVSGSAGGPFTITFTGSHSGQDVQLLWPIATDLTNANDLEVTTRYEFDAAGQLFRVTDPLGRMAVYEYDGLGRMTTQKRVSGDLPAIVALTTTPSTAVDEVQVVGFSDMFVGGGTFTLTFDGQTTSAITYNASAAAVQSALEALSNVGSGDVAVTKVTDSSTSQAWQLTFQGNLAGTNVPQTTVDSTNVTGGMGTIDTETTTTQGGDTNEEQTVTLSGATGGTFRLGFGGQWTSSLAYNASSGTVDSALEALTAIDNVSVSGSAGGPYTITFQGSLAGQDVPTLTVESTNLTNANLLLTDSRSAYDAAGRLVSVSDALGNVTEYDYDLLDNMVLITLPDPDGGGGGLASPETAYEFDAAGQLLEMTDPLGRVTTNEYDGLGRRTKTTQPDPDGAGGVSAPFTTFTYDAAGNLLTVTDPLSHVTEYEYDNLYRRVLITDAEAGETSFTYDANGRMLSLTDPVSNTTEWVYDNLGRKIEETNELEDGRTFEYDAVGNLVERVDRLGRIIVWEYDDLYRNTAEKWYDGVNLVHTLNWEYDAAGQLTDAYDVDSSYGYIYDGLGRLTEESQSFGDFSPLLEYERTYNAAGSVLTIQAIIGGTADFENAFTYDNLQRITRLEQAEYASGNTVAEKRFDFAYDAASAFTRLDRYADLAGSEYVASTHYAYDGLGRLARLTHNDSTSPAAGWGNNPLAGYQYAYDAASRITGINSYLDGQTDYTHDNTNQLTDADHSGMSDEAYTYDANGNRTGGSIDNDPNNQLASDGTYDYEYDDEGNRTAQETISTGERIEYAWDHRNRLVLVTFKNSGGTVIKTVEHTYDVNNRWIRRTIDPDGATGSDPLEETFFSHLDGQIALEFDGTTAGDLAHRYTWNPAAVDQLLADENALNEILYPLNDHLGTTRDLAEYDNGPDTPSVVNHRRFDSFGQIISQTNGSITILFGFTGRPYDDSTGLQNNWNRWYVSLNGTWLSEDPIGFEAGDANLARYVNNGPTTATDPLGQYAWSQSILQSPEATIDGQLGYKFRLKQTFSAGAGEMPPKFAPGAQTWQVSFIRSFALVLKGDKVTLEILDPVTKLDIVDIGGGDIVGGSLVRNDTISSRVVSPPGEKVILYVEATVRVMGFSGLDEKGKSIRLPTGVNRAPREGELEKIKANRIGPTLGSSFTYIYADWDECTKALEADLMLVNDWLGHAALGMPLPNLPKSGKYEYLRVDKDEWHFSK